MTELQRTGLEICGLDFSHSALLRFKAVSGDGASAVESTMTAALPFKQGAFKVVTAFTSLENVVEDEAVVALTAEIARVLAEPALLAVYLLDRQDGFYASLGAARPGDPCVTVDPATGLRQRLFTLEELSRLLHPRFALLCSAGYEFEDWKSGSIYTRRLTAGLWRKKG